MGVPRSISDELSNSTRAAVSVLSCIGVLEEARFFGISKAIEPLELMVQNEELALSGHFTRKEFLRMLSITSSSAILRCQVSALAACLAL